MSEPYFHMTFLEQVHLCEQNKSQQRARALPPRSQTAEMSPSYKGLEKQRKLMPLNK